MSPLGGLLQTAGVLGAFVCDGGGRLVARNLPSVFLDSMMLEADRRLRRLIAGLRWIGGIDRAALAFDEVRLILRPLAGGRLYVLCEPRVNLAHLELALLDSTETLNQVLATFAATAPPTGTRAEIETLIESELGDHAGRALRILAEAGDDHASIGAACDEIERLVRLFISRSKARQMAAAMEAILLQAGGSER